MKQNKKQSCIVAFFFYWYFFVLINGSMRGFQMKSFREPSQILWTFQLLKKIYFLCYLVILKHLDY